MLRQQRRIGSCGGFGGGGGGSMVTAAVALCARRDASLWQRFWFGTGGDGSSGNPAHAPNGAGNDGRRSGSGCGDLDVVARVMMARRSCKRFDPARDIDPAVLERIWDATVRCPTAFNLQGWTAVCVGRREGDAAVRAALCTAALSQPAVAEAPLTVVFGGYLHPTRNAPAVLEASLDSGHFRAAYGPPYLRMVNYMLHPGPANLMGLTKAVISDQYSAATGTPLLTVPPSMQAYAWKNTMIAVTHFMLAAESAGLATVVMEGIDERQVMSAVGLPTEDWTVPCIVSVGFPRSDAGAFHPTPSPRFGREHFVSHGRFNQRR